MTPTLNICNCLCEELVRPCRSKGPVLRAVVKKSQEKWKDFLLTKRMLNLSVHSLLRCSHFYLLDGKCLCAVFRNSCLQNLNIPRCVARVPSIRHCCIVTFLPCSPLPCLSANPPKRSHLFS